MFNVLKGIRFLRNILQKQSILPEQAIHYYKIAPIYRDASILDSNIFISKV